VPISLRLNSELILTPGDRPHRRIILESFRRIIGYPSKDDEQI